MFLEHLLAKYIGGASHISLVLLEMSYITSYTHDSHVLLLATCEILLYIVPGELIIPVGIGFQIFYSDASNVYVLLLRTCKANYYYSLRCI